MSIGTFSTTEGIASHGELNTTVVTLYCDASKKAWGGTLLKDGCSLESRDYWVDDSQDINILEAWA